MMDNTIVTSSDMGYLWGVFMMIASMRKNKMEEPVLVYARNYSDFAKRVIEGLGNVKIVDVPNTEMRSLTCAKPDALMLAKTRFATWVDCDGFFTKNCSKLLTPLDDDHIHIRIRSKNEVLGSRLSEVDENGNIIIARFMSDIWKKDIGEYSVPKLDRCCSACFLSVPTSRKSFLEKWSSQIKKVLPNDNSGVVDNRNPAYFQTDESVLNSLLCFMKDAPIPTENFNLDTPPIFIHFIDKPKPWVAWITNRSFKYFDEYVEIVEWAKAKGLTLPSEIPFSLIRQNKPFYSFLMPFIRIFYKLKVLSKKAGL